MADDPRLEALLEALLRRLEAGQADAAGDLDENLLAGALDGTLRDDERERLLEELATHARAREQLWDLVDVAGGAAHDEPPAADPAADIRPLVRRTPPRPTVASWHPEPTTGRSASGTRPTWARSPPCAGTARAWRTCPGRPRGERW